jgi:hypothetical protein
MPEAADFNIISVLANNGQILLTFIAIAGCVSTVYLREMVLRQRQRSAGSSPTASFSS